MKRCPGVRPAWWTLNAMQSH